MMDYEIFKEVLMDKFLSYMPKEYQGMKVKCDEAEKVNCKVDEVSLRGQDGRRIVSPAICISDIYDEYLRTGDLQETLQGAADAMDRMFKDKEATSLEMGKAKENIIFQLVNTAQNEDMLKNMPHREFQDLSIIYRLVVSIDGRKMESAAVCNELAEKLGMDEGQLYKVATENTRRILPPVVKTMEEVIGVMALDAEPQEMMWLISNERMVGGAVSMLYEDKLHELAENMESDLYLIPASVHEVIAVSVGMGTPENLAETVAEVNMEQLSLEERLSNQVYHYDKDLRKVTLATDTPNKRLDGIVAGQGHSHEAKQSR